MWPYWLMLLIPAWGVLSSQRLPAGQARAVLMLVGVVFALMMGLRHEVGGDWGTYENHFEAVSGMSFSEVMQELTDPGYYGLSWLLAQLGANIYALNLLCAIPLVIGMIVLARRQPMPWMALFAAVPYLLMVVGMGYTRQSAAIGFAMLGLSALGRGRAVAFVAWVLVGALFHKTAVLLLPIAGLAATRNRIWTLFWVGVMTGVGTWLFLSDSSDNLWANYVQSDYADASQGAGIRVAMNVVPAVLMLWLRQRLVPDPLERRLWIWMSILSLACVPLLQLSPTAVDRMALYFIPLQLFVFARLPSVAPASRDRTLIVLGIVGYYTSVEYVWLNFAAMAYAWVPYQFMPLGS
jgi:hypothetical protein